MCVKADDYNFVIVNYTRLKKRIYPSRDMFELFGFEFILIKENEWGVKLPEGWSVEVCSTGKRLFYDEHHCLRGGCGGSSYLGHAMHLYPRYYSKWDEENLCVSIYDRATSYEKPFKTFGPAKDKRHFVNTKIEAEDWLEENIPNHEDILHWKNN